MLLKILIIIFLKKDTMKFKRFVTFYILLLLLVNSVYCQKWLYSNHLYSNNFTNITTSEIDNVSNLYVIGVFAGTMQTQKDTIISAGLDIFLAKYNDQLQLQWINKIGGPNIEIKPQFAIDDNNNIIITGAFKDTCYFNKEKNNFLYSEDDYDVFIAKYDADGNFMWAKTLAGNKAFQTTRDIDVDVNNDFVFSIGYKDSVNIFDTVFAGRSGVENSIIGKLNSNGEKIWFKNIISTADGSFTSVSAHDESYYFTGTFIDTLFLDNKTLSETASTQDLFLYKTDNNGIEKWVRRTYGNGNDFSGTSTRDNYDNIYYTGYFNSTTLSGDSTASLTSHDLQNKGNSDIFIFKYNTNGNLLWSKSYGDIRDERTTTIYEMNNILYITGWFENQIVFGNDTLNSSGDGDYDFFIGTFDTDGNKLRAVGLETKGEQKTDYGAAISVNENNDVFISGYFQSDTVIVGDSIYARVGSNDIFIARYLPCFNATFTSVKHVSCYGGNNGRLEVTPYFGVPPFNYAWSHDTELNSNIADTLLPATYTVTVTDANDSTAVASIDITQPDPIAIADSVINVSCHNTANGKIYIDVTGGTAKTDYTYKWLSEGSGLKTKDKNQTGLSTGTFYLTVTDDNSCSAFDSFAVTQPEPIIFNNTTVTDVTAPGAGDGSIDLSVSGGTGSPGSAFFSYAWTGPDNYNASTQDISSLDGGQYSVTVTDSLGCEADTSLLVNEGNNLIAFISYKKDVNCFGDATGMAVVDITGETGTLSYNWEDDGGISVGGDNDTIANITAGTYLVTVTDDNDTAYASVDISEPSAALTSMVNGIDVKCADAANGIVELTVNGGTMPYAYNWNNGAKTEDLNGVIPATYTVTVTDANGCITNESQQIIGAPPISLNITIEQEIACYGLTNGRVMAEATGGTPASADSKDYLWNDPAHQNSRTADNLSPGSYTVTVTDGNDCKVTGSVNLIEPPELIVTENHTSGCNDTDDGAIQLTVNGGTPDYSFAWNNFETTRNLSGLSPGNYTATVTDSKGCNDTVNVTVINPPAISVASATGTDIAGCYGDSTGTIEVDASGGTGTLTFAVIPAVAESNDSGSFVNITAGNYRVKITDQNGCTDTTENIQINEPALLVIDSVAVTFASTPTAGDGIVTVYASGGSGNLSYVLGPDSIATNQTGSFASLDTGTYTISVSNTYDCGPVENTDIEIGYLTGINNVADNDFKIYPNPSDGRISLEINKTLAYETLVVILNSSGQQIYAGKIKPGVTQKTYDLSGYPAGIYHIRITGREIIANKKVTIE